MAVMASDLPMSFWGFQLENNCGVRSDGIVYVSSKLFQKDRLLFVYAIERLQ